MSFENIHFTTNHHIALAIVSSTSSTLSILGSICIIHLARNKLDRPYHCIMILLSIADIFFSLSLILQPFFTPSTELFSIGTQATCNIVGFMFHVSSIMGAIQNFILSFYFVLTIRYRWNITKVTKSFQQPSQIPTILIPVAVGVAGFVTKSYNPFPNTLFCSLESSPPLCGKRDHVDEECQRGEYAWLIINAQIVIVVLSSLIGFIGTALVYQTVRSTIRKSARYDISMTSRQAIRTKRIATVGTQALFFSLVYLNQFMWPVINFMVRIFLGDIITTTPNFILTITIFTFYPLQGALNCLVYVRPNYVKQRQKYPHLSACTILQNVLKISGLRNNNNSSMMNSMMAAQTSMALHSNFSHRSGILTRPSRFFARRAQQNINYNDDGRTGDNGNGDVTFKHGANLDILSSQQPDQLQQEQQQDEEVPKRSVQSMQDESFLVDTDDDEYFEDLADDDNDNASTSSHMETEESEGDVSSGESKPPAKKVMNYT